MEIIQSRRRYSEMDIYRVDMISNEGICAASAIESNMTVESSAQEVVTYDFSETDSFSPTWE